MKEKPSVLIMIGKGGASPPEMVLRKAKIASTLDLAEISKSSKFLDQVIICTDIKDLCERSKEMRLKIEYTGNSDQFNFGQKFREIIRKYSIESVMYFGGGSGILIEQRDIDRLAQWISGHRGVAVANNFYSTDFIALNPASYMLESDLGRRDNTLGWKARKAGLVPFELRRSTKTQYDLDTPIDLQILKVSNLAKGRVMEYIKSMDSADSRISKTISMYNDPDKRIVLAGRVGASTWSYLEENAACRFNVFSEGRGMFAEEREKNKQPFLLGYMAEERGIKGLIDVLLENGDALFLDTRVLFTYYGNWPPARDRFYSDMIRPEKVSHGLARELSSIAKESEKPIILGGHSILSGGQYLLVDSAWRCDDTDNERINPKVCDALISEEV